MAWLDTALEQAATPISVDVSDLDLGQDTIEVMPLSAAEYQAIKTHPDLRGLTGDDRNESLGLRVVHEMLSKCDSTITWSKFIKLPLSLLTVLTQRIMAAIGSDGGGVLGES